MSKVIEYLEDIGLTDFKKIKKYFANEDISRLNSLNEYMSKLTFEDWEISEYSPYMFVPSFDLSGFGGCNELGCKSQRATRLNKFAGLYSDVIYIFVDSISNPQIYDWEEENENQFRYRLICDYSLILIYKHLIQRKIARIIPVQFSICPDCFKENVYKKTNLKNLEELVEEYTNKACFKAIEYNCDIGTTVIEIDNLIEIFPEHSVFMSVENEFYGELNSIDSFPSEIGNYNFKRQIVEEIVYDQYSTFSLESLFSSAYGAKLLTSRESDTNMMNAFSDSPSKPGKLLTFQMPFLENMDPESIIALRENNYHTFNDYRIALDKAIKAYYVEGEEINSQEVYDDIIYPAFIKLDSTLKRTKNMRVFKSASELIVALSTISIGVYNSIMFPEPNIIIPTLGSSLPLVKQIKKAAENKLNSNNELETKDFYFLWKLNERRK